MIGDLYNYVSNVIVGQVPIEFEFIIALVVIVFCFLIIYVVFSGFILLNDLFGK